MTRTFRLCRYAYRASISVAASGKTSSRLHGAVPPSYPQPRSIIFGANQTVRNIPKEEQEKAVVMHEVQAGIGRFQSNHACKRQENWASSHGKQGNNNISTRNTRIFLLNVELNGIQRVDPLTASAAYEYKAGPLLCSASFSADMWTIPCERRSANAPGSERYRRLLSP